MTLFEKIYFLKQLKSKEIYRECLSEADLRELRLSRRIPIYLVKLNCFLTLYLLVKVRNFKNRKGKDD